LTAKLLNGKNRYNKRVKIPERKFREVLHLFVLDLSATITTPVIKAAKEGYVLAIGEDKKKKYEEALINPTDIASIPAILVLDRTWIFGD